MMPTTTASSTQQTPFEPASSTQTQALIEAAAEDATVDLSRTDTTNATIDLPLGTTPDGAPVSWRLTDTQGRPQHGLIVGPSGAGGSTALARLATGAHTVGVRTIVVSLDHDPDYPDPAWTQAPWDISWRVDPDELIRDLGEVLARLGPAPDPQLVLVDSASALRAAPHLWKRLLLQADRLRMSVVARAHSLAAAETGTSAVRDLLLAHGQYLALGRPMGHREHLARALLRGYTAPAGRRVPGHGVYGYRGDTVPVAVSNPR